MIKQAVAPGKATSMISSESPRLAVPPTWNKIKVIFPSFAAAANASALTFSESLSIPAAPKPLP